MRFERRQLLAAAGALLAGCRSGGRRRDSESPLDELLEAHADALPERAGAGANHYPMAAEALEALGREDAIRSDWIEGAALYEGRSGVAAIERDDWSEALGDYERYGDWLALFRAELQGEPWPTVVENWVPELMPGLCAGAYHGIIRTGHAVRAARKSDTSARRDELAVGLAYWASRYVELPSNGAPDEDLQSTLAELEHPWVDDRADVDFFGVVDRLVQRPIAPALSPAPLPEAELDAVVREATTAFLEMLVLERHRIWLLHTVTGPAAVQWLLPELDEADGRRLVAQARQSVVAMYAAFGEPYSPRAHVRPAPAPWTELVDRVVETRSVHGIKLFDALLRFDRDGDPLWRSVAEQWLEWT